MTINEKIFAGFESPPGHYYTAKACSDMDIMDYHFSLMKKGLFWGKEVDYYEVRIRDYDTPQQMVKYCVELLFARYKTSQEYVDPYEEFKKYIGE